MKLCVSLFVGAQVSQSIEAQLIKSKSNDSVLILFSDDNLCGIPWMDRRIGFYHIIHVVNVTLSVLVK